MSLRSLRSWWLVLSIVLSLGLTACGGSDDETKTTDTADTLGDSAGTTDEDTIAGDVAADTIAPDTAADTVADTAPDTGECVPTTPVYEGTPWIMGAQIAPVGCIKLTMVLEVKGELAAGKTLQWVRLHSVSKCGVSNSLMQLDNVAISADGKATLVFQGLKFPAAYSPTGSDVEIDLTLNGSVKSADLFCGNATGYLAMFAADLAGSEFAAQPADKATDPPLSSCSGEGCPVALEHIDAAKCPTMTDGDGEIESAGLKRTFRVFTPEGLDKTKPAPLVFLWHGIGDSIDVILQQSGFDKQVQTGQFILVVPQGQSTDKVPTQWSYVSSSESPDSYLFDDLLTCAGKAYSIDAKRVYSVGFSGGAMWTSWLSSFRSDKFAAVAIFSGGLIDGVKYSNPQRKFPTIVVQGGAEDKAFGVDLGALAKQLVGVFVSNGQYTVSCEHALGHKFPQEMSAAVRKLFNDVTFDGPAAPYAQLPVEFPAWCTIAK